MRRATEGFDFLSDEGSLGYSLDVEIVSIGQRTFVYAADAASSDLEIFRLDDTGRLIPRGTVADSANVTLAGVSGLGHCVVGGSTYLLASGYSEDGLTTFKVGRNGSLTPVDTLFDSPAFELDEAFGDIKTVTFGTRTFALLPSVADNGIQSVEVLADGTIVARGFADDTAATLLAAPLDLATAEVKGRQFVIVPAYGENGLSTLELKANGSLQYLTSAADQPDLALNAVITVATGQVGNKTFVYAGGSEAGISAFRVGGDGSLKEVGTFFDSAIIDETSNLEFVTAGGKNYLFASDGGYSSINVFEIGKNGKLDAVGLLQDNDDTSLAQIQTFSVAVENGRTVLITTGVGEGASTFEIDFDDFGGAAAPDHLF